MCRWGCTTADTTYMCKWCGTRFCKACLRGEFGTGFMKESTWCVQCNQKKCAGKRVEYVPTASTPDAKSAKSAKNSKSGKNSKSSKSIKLKSANKSKKGKTRR